MKPSKIIDNYCRLYGVTMPSLDLSQTEYFVMIDSSEARIRTYQRSTLLGQIVCSAMKRGVVLHVRNGWVKPIEWDTWKEFWSRYFAPKKRESKNIPEPYRAKRKEPSMFDEGMQSRPSKKPKKGSAEFSHRANLNLHLMGSYIPTRPIA